DAIAHSNKILDSDPDNIDALERKSYALIGLKKLDEALRCKDIILKLEPKNCDVLEEKGDLLIEMGRDNEALRILDKLLELECGDVYYLGKKAEIYKKLNDTEAELDCYSKMIEYDHPPALLNKATILIDRGEFDDAIKLLNRMYGCESHDTLWAPALLQKARAAAIQNDKENMIENLKKAMRTTISFVGTAHHYSKQYLIEDIEETSEFDKYRTTEEFQFVMNFEWEREDEIELENKIKHYLEKKNLNPEQLETDHLGLIEYLCKYPESNIYLDFILDEKRKLLINSTKSITIVSNDHMILKNLRYGSNYYKDKTESFSRKIKKIEDITGPNEKSYNLNRIRYKKDDIKTAIKILGGDIDALFPETIFPLILTSISSFIGEDAYRVYRKRKSDRYSVLINPLSNNDS
ncbi:MAG: hypothetical protein KAW66_11220, partial [Candidatus Lokiarchaeota archaeon]|nr:hypothetical protein [Candidatus Lokiarchaeota archaeon]